MEIFDFYEAGKKVLSGFSTESVYLLLGVIVWSVVIFGALFILQGVGLYTMAKRRNMRRKYLAFIPFANIYYLGKIVGECGFFGHRMKNAGLYAMIAQILSLIFSCAYIFAECYFYITYGEPVGVNEMGTPCWLGLTETDATLWEVYNVTNALYLIVSLVVNLLMIVLMMGLYKKYAPGRYMLLTMLTLFVPAARYITIFVIRKREPFDYDAYIRAR